MENRAPHGWPTGRHRKLLKAQNVAVRLQASAEADALRTQNRQLRERVDQPVGITASTGGRWESRPQGRQSAIETKPRCNVRGEAGMLVGHE
jgi:hypothetical protein